MAAIHQPSTQEVSPQKLAVLRAFYSIYQQTVLLQAECAFTYRDMRAYEALNPLVSAFLKCRDRLVNDQPQLEDALFAIVEEQRAVWRVNANTADESEIKKTQSCELANLQKSDDLPD